MSALTVAIAQSDDVDTDDAIDEIIASVEEQLGGAPVAGLLFASLLYDHAEMLALLHARWPGIQLIGGSTDGEFTRSLGYREDSIVLVAFASDTLCFRAGVATGLGEDSHATTLAALDALLVDGEQAPSLAFVMPDGLTVNASRMFQAFQERLGDGFTVLGGLSGDHWGFEECFQFCGTTVYEDAVPVLLVWGEVALTTGVASGWMPVGPPMQVTAIDGNDVLEIDGRPAFEVFEEHFGPIVRDAFGEYPLAVYVDPESTEYYLRAVFHLDEEKGLVQLRDEIPVGTTVRLSNVDHARIVDGTSQSIARALDACPRTPDVVLVVSCSARKWMLGEAVVDEFTIIREALDQRDMGDVPFVGFYAFGEIGPVAGESRFHNETCVSIALAA